MEKSPANCSLGYGGPVLADVNNAVATLALEGVELEVQPLPASVSPGPSYKFCPVQHTFIIGRMRPIIKRF